MKAAAQTARPQVFGQSALLPRMLIRLLHPDASVLDFGAGPDAVYTRFLRDHDFQVTAYDFPVNQRLGVHDTDALSRLYDTVFASNVLNVQSSMGMLERTLQQIYDVVVPLGRFYANYPTDPRKVDLSGARLVARLGSMFGVVRILAGGYSAPVVECRKLRF